MKKFIAIMALALVSFASQARVDENSSWSKIRRSPGLYVNAPKITFQGGSVFVPVFGICHTEENGVEILEGGKFKQCTKWARRGDDHVCVAEKTITLKKERTYEAKYCARYRNQGGDHECVEYRTYTKTEALDYEIEVFTSRRGGDHSNFPAFTKSFSIPSCK